MEYWPFSCPMTKLSPSQIFCSNQQSGITWLSLIVYPEIPMYEVTDRSFLNLQMSGLKLFVNGILRQQGKTHFPKCVPSKVSCNVGSAASQANSNTAFSWQLGNVHFFEDYLTYSLPLLFNCCRTKEAFLLYILGPNYAAGFDVDATLFQAYNIINSKNIDILSIVDCFLSWPLNA